MDAYLRLVCYCLICGWIVTVVQTGAIEKRKSDAVKNEDTGHIFELLERLSSATKIKSKRHFVNQKPTRETTRQTGKLDRRQGGWYCWTCRISKLDDFGWLQLPQDPDQSSDSETIDFI